MTPRDRNYRFEPGNEYTKKEILEITELSHNTLDKSLQTARLSTSRRTYSGDELLDRFLMVRKCVDAGRTYEEVAEQFSLLDAKSAPLEETEYSSYEGTEGSVDGLSAIDDIVTENLQAALQEISREAVRDFIEALPLYVAYEAYEGRKQFDSALRRSFRAFSHQMKGDMAKRKKRQKIFGPKAFGSRFQLAPSEEKKDEGTEGEESEADSEEEISEEPYYTDRTFTGRSLQKQHEGKPLTIQEQQAVDAHGEGILNEMFGMEPEVQ